MKRDCVALILRLLLAAHYACLFRCAAAFCVGNNPNRRRTATLSIRPATPITDAELPRPYQGEQFADALAEIFVAQALPYDEELLWVPQTESVSFRPLCLCVSGGYYVNLLRVKGSGLLSRHRHPGPVHGHVLKGRWKYLEHSWEAGPGSYVFEPPGEIHTLVVPPGVDEMITLFHVTGALLYCDVDGRIIGAEDVFTKLELAQKHYAAVGLGDDFVQQFVR
jgi:2,4'-dihydroxyacetophenone dioxygenase